MTYMKILYTLNLQLFAEGGSGDGTGVGTGAMGENGMAATSATNGVKGNPLADVKYGIQDEDEAQTPTVQNNDGKAKDLNAEFEKLIKGEYKQAYNDRVSNTVRQRLKATDETVKRYEALSPVLEMLGNKYGVDASDVSALSKAIEDDDSFFEDEALEKGITVEQLKEIRKMERENATLKKQMQEQETRENASRLYASWMEQSEKLKAVYPSFDLETEMQNPKFVDLLRVPSIDVRTAYEVLHKDEIIPAAMQFTAKAVEQKLTNKIMASGSRPAENGIASQSAAVVKRDVSQLTKADRAEIIRRVQRGEKIRF